MKTLRIHSHEVLLDDEDYQRVVDAETTYSRHWTVVYNKNGVARVSLITGSGHDQNCTNMNLSRFVLNYHGPSYVDHINRNPLDNQKHNLRIVSPAENRLNSKLRSDNTSNHNGVHFHIRVQKWAAYINMAGVRYNLGYFSTKEEAIKARKNAEDAT